jgi:predicted ATPase
MARDCRCATQNHAPRFIVLTGGPGAGKTAVLEVARRRLCRHVAILPESASIVFGGGFPRRRTEPARRAAQRAIYHMQRELERMTDEERESPVVLCDRGTLDGVAYWPETAESFWRDLGTSREGELRRYAVVIHLRTPSDGQGYNHQNPIRIEAAEEAARIDERILGAWEGHPRRIIVDSADDFMVKLARAYELIRAEVPECCQVRDEAELGPAVS